jgi:serine/threonine protein kinase
MLHLAPGVVFARDYRIVKALAEGGMGAVYVAEQLSTGKPRALKLMHAQLVADARSRARFEQEARIGATLDSDHIVEVVGAGIDDASGTPWLAMELLKGEDLAALVERRGALAPAEVAAVFEQLGHALGAAHAAKIVHRDLKPENVFLAIARRRDVPFTVKLLDFGIAKVVQESRASTTQAMGSPLWMAPEQTEATGISPATDVWALGLLAYHLLTGEYFWRAARVQDGTAMMQLLREILVEPIASASVRAQEDGVFARLPQGFEGWFARCVARDPRERFAEANAATQGLVALLRAQASAHPSWDPTLAHPATQPGPLPPGGLAPATAPTPPHAPTATPPLALSHAPTSYAPAAAQGWPPTDARSVQGTAAPSPPGPFVPQASWQGPPSAPQWAPEAPQRTSRRWLVGGLVATSLLSVASLSVAYYLFVGDDGGGTERTGPAMTPLVTNGPPSIQMAPMPAPAPVPMPAPAPVPGGAPPTVTMTPLPPDPPPLQATPAQHQVAVGIGTVLGDPRLIGPVNLRVRSLTDAFAGCFRQHGDSQTGMRVMMVQWEIAADGTPTATPRAVSAQGPAAPAVLQCLEGLLRASSFPAPARLTRCAFPLTVTAVHASDDEE